MNATFLRVELVTRDGQPSPLLINLDHIVRVTPAFPEGATIVTTDDASLLVRASLDELHAQMVATNGRVVVKRVGPVTE